MSGISELRQVAQTISSSESRKDFHDSIERDLRAKNPILSITWNGNFDQLSRLNESSMFLGQNGPRELNYCA
jgi:hypothetical protein